VENVTTQISLVR